ncbi:MAG TPA: hypothetical protein DEQ61_21285 [Streptomyces sp.]|nr:hypothetical protein [Streptomyces sp.]
MHWTRPVVTIVALLCVVAGLTACGAGAGSPDTDTLRLGAIATGSAPEEKERYEAIADQLSESLDMEIELITSTEYFAIAEGLRGGKVDVAFLNSLGYVLTDTKVDLKPLAVGVDEADEPGYFSYLITSKPDEIRGPADVKGHSLAMASRLSTSGYLYPTKALENAGIDPEEDATLSSGGNHAANILAVGSGQVDAAFVDSVEYESAVKNGKVDPEKVVKVWESDRITGSPVVARSELDAELLDRVRKALLDLKGTEDVPLGVEKTLKMGPVKPEDFDPIRKLATEIGLSVEDMKE